MIEQRQRKEYAPRKVEHAASKEDLEKYLAARQRALAEEAVRAKNS